MKVKEEERRAYQNQVHSRRYDKPGPEAADPDVEPEIVAGDTAASRTKDDPNKRYLQIDIERVNFDLVQLDTINSPYTPEQKMAAVVAYVMTGNAREASELAGVSYVALRQWKTKSPWWGAAVIAAQNYLNQQLDGHMTKIINRIMQQLETNLIQGEERMTARGDIVMVKPNTSTLLQGMTTLFSLRERAREANRSVKQRDSDVTQGSLNEIAAGFAAAGGKRGD